MVQEWLELTELTGGAPIIVERVKLSGKGIHIEGEFELPPLARLSSEDQVFVMAFIRSDGSIKELERLFGISYPTVKSRLARIAGQFEYVQQGAPHASSGTKGLSNVPDNADPVRRPPSPKDDIIELLRRGDISAAQAIERLSK